MQIVVPRNTLDVVLVCDPASSTDPQASRTAVIVVGMSPGLRLFVLDAWAKREPDPYYVLDHMFAVSVQHQPRLWGIEAVGYQKTLQPWAERLMRERGVYYPVEPLSPDRYEKKQDRIMSLSPFARAGQVYVQRGMLALLEEWEVFPDPGSPRDLLDALAYAVRLLVPKTPQGGTAGVEARLQALAQRDAASARYWRKDYERRGLIEAEATLEELLDSVEDPAAVGLGEWT